MGRKLLKISAVAVVVVAVPMLVMACAAYAYHAQTGQWEEHWHRQLAARAAAQDPVAQRWLAAYVAYRRTLPADAAEAYAPLDRWLGVTP